MNQLNFFKELGLSYECGPEISETNDEQAGDQSPDLPEEE